MSSKRTLKEKLEIAETIINADKRTAANYATHQELRSANRTIVLLIACLLALGILLLLPKERREPSPTRVEKPAKKYSHPSINEK